MEAVSVRISRRTAAVTAALATLVMAGVGATAPRAHAADPARARSCGWILEPSADRENILFPDITTRYLGADIPVPPGGYIKITGEFPHARYMSLQAYSSTLQTTSDLRDTQIAPDPGSTNPFFAGADRNAAHRSYTVRIVSGSQPASGPAPNTLYDTSPDGSKSGHAFAYRIYLPDASAGPFGGVPAPAITLVLAGGQEVPLPTCQDPLTDVGLTQSLAGLGPADWGLPNGSVLASPTPVWHKYVNAPNGYFISNTDSPLVPAALEQAGISVTNMLPAGLGENADNKYVFTEVSQEYGEVAVFRAKMPTTPRTYAGEARMGTGQLRYWSMCTGTPGTQTLGCTVDEQTPVNRRRYYTLVVSTAADRPADATTSCGVAWLPWGPDPKGVLMMRNMLPSATFTHAVQNSTPGTEQQTLGAYYPVGRYYATPEAFDQAVGCHPQSRSSHRAARR
jgi:hypothetical protein